MLARFVGGALDGSEREVGDDLQLLKSFRRVNRTKLNLGDDYYSDHIKVVTDEYRLIMRCKNIGIFKLKKGDKEWQFQELI